MDITFEGTKNNMSLTVNKPSFNTIINFPPPQANDEVFPHIDNDEIPHIDDIPEEAYEIHGDIPPAEEVENDPRAYPADLLPEEAL